MLEYLENRLGQVVDSLIDPIWQKLLASPWWLRVLFLLLIAPVAYDLYSPQDAVSAWRLASAMVRVAAAGGPTLPLSPTVRQKAQEVALRIAGTLQGEIDEPTSSHITPWALAQETLASYPIITHLDSKRIAAYMRANVDTQCACWREIPENAGTPHVIFISGWIMTTLAHIGETVDMSFIAFLLREQNRDGWWSTFPVTPDSQYASSYSTAWALLGLKAQLSAATLDEATKSQVSAAIQKGSAWLLSQRERGSRWKDYPLVRYGHLSISISGAALHALHQTVGDRLRQVDAEWLDALPSNAISISDADHPYVWFDARGASANDNYVQIQLPWVLVATADAYENGSFWQRVHAVAWVEEALSQQQMNAADTTPDNWWRAELLFAIEYLLGTNSRA